ncbi:hypothetical protein GCM10011344_31270 [Dokdonia pacifica]|uniref:Uncharacterized protein n=2 Tax=Dokdonia pacifica TaxID=1627892 RepID=A0A239BNW9_9FLAO|nr:hypothetical protein GCM10011344_31270 [Dokdonia pacifica]SNS09795.1 hypothetical protein SAMN06265376_106343 [Dokdonia pacifica]
MEFFDSLSNPTKVLVIFIGLAVLFMVVFANNNRNKNKLYRRKKRNFKDNYEAKKKEKSN